MAKWLHTPPWYAGLIGEVELDEEFHRWTCGEIGDVDFERECEESKKTTQGRLVTEAPEVVTLCGSTRFKEAFLEEQRRLTMEGIIVISVGTFGWDEGRPEDVFGEEMKAALDELHKRKIDISDRIHVINVGGYVGSSTASEIEYAAKAGKVVTFMERLS